MRTKGHSGTAVAVLFVVANLAGRPFAAEPHPTATPSPTVTKRDMHLGEYAQGKTLDPSEMTTTNGSIVITNETVDRIGDLGALTPGLYVLRRVNPPEFSQGAGDDRTVAKRRAHWRTLVDAQRENIAKTETELAMLDAKIDSLEDAAFHGGRGAARMWARHDEAKRQRRIVERRLTREKAKLAAIIRQARNLGAQPGWFR